ncbi:MAG: hypothetical protein HRF49_01895 [bacterium]|jgi:hypothetical protein
MLNWFFLYCNRESQRQAMPRKNETTDAGSVFKSLLAGLPHSGARKIVECEAMQVLWESFPEDLRGRAAPAAIHYVKDSKGVARSVCEIWVDDKLTWSVLSRDREKLIKTANEVLGRVVIEELSHKIAPAKMLKQRIRVLDGG